MFCLTYYAELIEYYIYLNIRLHLQELRSSDRRLSRNHNQLQKRHIDTFIAWFSDKCDWANIVNGLKVDDGFVLVNLHEGQSQFEKDPFILASQAKQVFYCRENETSNWYDFNLHDQTIDGSSITLASYIGILAREHVPITLESWKKVDEQKKDMIWSSLLQYFKLLDSSKDYIFKKMGGRWRQYKSRITKKLIEVSQGPRKKRALKPKNVTNAGDWNEFVKQRTSEQFKERSKNFRAMRLSQKIQHTTGRMGYAQLHHIMKNEAKEKGKDPEKITRVDVWIEGHKRKKNKPLSEAVQTIMDEINQLRVSTCPPNDNNINEDSLAKVLGAEKRGRVRGLGFGATPSRVQTQIQSGGRVKQLEAELKATNDQVASLKDMIMKQNDQLLNRGVQMEYTAGSHVCTPPHVFTPQV
ncbi:hypothetical protein ACOSP7_009191 [Xanthoceras sorbifolium]